MQYDLMQKVKDLNAELFILGVIDEKEYFYYEDLTKTYAELFTINLN